jgi:hypothetical protein
MARLKVDPLNGTRTDDELRAQLRPGGDHHRQVVAGGAWRLHTEMRDGDLAALERLRADYERMMGPTPRAFGPQRPGVRLRNGLWPPVRVAGEAHWPSS